MSVVAWPLPLLFDPDKSPRREQRVREHVADAPKHEPRLLCAACRQIVTYPIHRISIDGVHEHSRTNPEGVSYRIGCYREANGCAPIGRGTLAFTWFNGYAWRVVLCKNCGTHLGWRFDAVGDHFFGLIVERLIVEQQPNEDSTGR